MNNKNRRMTRKQTKRKNEVYWKTAGDSNSQATKAFQPKSPKPRHK